MNWEKNGFLRRKQNRPRTNYLKIVNVFMRKKQRRNIFLMCLVQQLIKVDFAFEINFFLLCCVLFVLFWGDLFDVHLSFKRECQDDR